MSSPYVSTSERETNEVRTSLLTHAETFLLDDWPLHLTGSVDSFGGVGVVQAPAAWQMNLQVGVGSFVNMQRFPDAMGAYIQLSTFQIASRQAAGDAVVTVFEVDYLEPGLLQGTFGKVHPLTFFDSRNNTPAPFPAQRAYPLPITDSGLSSLGAFQATVLMTSAAAAHAISYDIICSVQVLYLLRQSRHDLELVGALSNVAQHMHQHSSLLSRIIHHLPGNEVQEEPAAPINQPHESVIRRSL